VHARGAGAYGYFEPYDDSLAEYTAARFLTTPGLRTPVFVRFVQAGHQLKCFCGLARQQPQHPKAPSDHRFELKNGLDDIDPGPLRATRRGTSFRDGEPARPGGGLPASHQRGNGFGALARRDRPHKRQQVAPVSVGRKKRRQRRLVRALERDFELPEPLRDQRLFGLDDALAGDQALSSIHDWVLMQ
jgi:hypothetical protein